jgi:acetyl esterase/lipase
VLTSSPTPGALLIRGQLNAQSAKTKVEMEKHAAGVDNVDEITDQRYVTGSAATLLDVYFPSRRHTDKPTLVWFHGGGWLAGDKADASPYFRLIASKGYTVVSVGYSLAPEHTYPVALRELSQSLAYLETNANRLHVNAKRLVLGGDSAGAQLASQLAALTTNASYAHLLGITPALSRAQLSGVVLDCGVYDASPYIDGTDGGGILGFAVATLMWSYTGTKDKSAPVFKQLSTIDYVTAEFPPAFISGGNADPLTDGQARPLAAKLTRLGIPVTTRLYAADHRPKLEHEYQFHLDLPDARDTLRATEAFLAALPG